MSSEKVQAKETKRTLRYVPIAAREFKPLENYTKRE